MVKATPTSVTPKPRFRTRRRKRCKECKTIIPLSPRKKRKPTEYNLFFKEAFQRPDIQLLGDTKSKMKAVAVLWKQKKGKKSKKSKKTKKPVPQSDTDEESVWEPCWEKPSEEKLIPRTPKTPLT